MTDNLHHYVRRDIVHLTVHIFMAEAKDIVYMGYKRKTKMG